MREIESFEKQGMELSCAHCKAESYVPIRFDEQNAHFNSEHDCPWTSVSILFFYKSKNIEKPISGLELKPDLIFFSRCRMLAPIRGRPWGLKGIQCYNHPGA